jgi:hypothetical protein
MIIVDGNIPQRNFVFNHLIHLSETSITIPIGINIPNMAAKVARYLSEYIYQLLKA